MYRIVIYKSLYYWY